MSCEVDRQVYKREMVDGFLIARAFIAVRYFEDHPLKRAPVSKYEGAVRKDQNE